MGRGDAGAAVGAVSFELAEILLEDVDAALELQVRVGRQLDLDSLETDAQVLELVIVVVELLLQVGDAVLQKDDALRRSLGTLDEEVVDVLHLFLPRFEVLGDLRQLLIELVGLGDELLGLRLGDASPRARFPLFLGDALLLALPFAFAHRCQ